MLQKTNTNKLATLGMLDELDDYDDDKQKIVRTHSGVALNKDGIKVGPVFWNMLVIATGFLQFGKSF